MRRFELINADGSKFDMTSKEVIFHDPTGLGFEREDSVRRVGKRWVRVEKSLAQLPISGSIAFIGEDPYSQYFSFANFCSVDPLILVYSANGIEYYRNVTVKTLEKTELNHYGYLDCPIEFMTLTPWYKKVTVVTKPSKKSNRPGWIWDATWNPTFQSSQPMTLKIISDSKETSPCKLTIKGPMENPHWRHYVNGRLKSEGSLNYTIPEDYSLVIDNSNDPYDIKIYDPAGRFYLDVYELSDFSTERFINLEHGNNLIVVSSLTNQETELQAEGMIYYETV